MTVLPGSLSHLLRRNAQLKAVVLGQARYIFKDGRMDSRFKMSRFRIEPVLYVILGRNVDVNPIVLQIMLSVQATEVAGEKLVPVISLAWIRRLVSIRALSNHIHVHVLYVIDTIRQKKSNKISTLHSGEHTLRRIAIVGLQAQRHVGE